MSPGTARRDRVGKAKLSACQAVRDRRLVDHRLANPETRVVEVYELGEGQYRRAVCRADDDALSASLVPGLTIPLFLWG